VEVEGAQVDIENQPCQLDQELPLLQLVAAALVNILVTLELLEPLHLLVVLLQQVADVAQDITIVIQNQEVLVAVVVARR
jgi:hypothetical protein